jgi:hypothetical protein
MSFFDLYTWHAPDATLVSFQRARVPPEDAEPL